MPTLAGWNPASPAWAGAAALREGRGPAQARQGLPTKLLFLFDPFKNYSLQILGQLRGGEAGGAGHREGCSGSALGTPGPGGSRSAPLQPPAGAEHQWPLQETSVSARGSGSTAPSDLPGPPAPARGRWAAAERALGTATPQSSAWPREKSCTAKSPRAGSACSARARSSMGRRWTCSCPWASPAPARKSPARAPATLGFAPARRPGVAQTSLRGTRWALWGARVLG